jgi:hypothetical protein
MRSEVMTADHTMMFTMHQMMGQPAKNIISLRVHHDKKSEAGEKGVMRVSKVVLECYASNQTCTVITIK